MDNAIDSGRAPGDVPFAGDALFVLGLKHAAGPRADLVTAHKWFNLAAMQGNKEAARLRLEIAVEMSQAEIAAAQRAARVWLIQAGSGRFGTISPLSYARKTVIQ